MSRVFATVDGNEAVARVAYKVNEVIAIYPITPSSPMGEWADEWAAKGVPNIWGTVPTVVEMQSEGGAAAAVHGAVQTGSLCTTFTASQGLLLMIPNMFKIAGELTPAVIHVSARTVATHALSIFGDHSDVMAVRQTGWALLASSSVQEAHDNALIAQAATLRSRVPFLHFFDGFRTSHEVNKIELISEEVMARMITPELVAKHRERALSPDRPVIRGTAQNPDVFFQARERCNPFYAACPEVVQQVMDEFASLTGRRYNLFDYVGSPNAERVIVIMGSGAETASETARYLADRGEKVGVVVVRLYRPFSARHFLRALPATVKAIAVMDRTKEPGAVGEPLFEDVVSALAEGIRDGVAPFSSMPLVIGGRYGLSSKEFTPAMVKAVFDELAKESPKPRFTVGIEDDVTHLSLKYDPSFSVEDPKVKRCVFFGLGADGTVSANKNSIKIIGEETDNYAQGYFVYDSKKSGSVTVSHLRFGPNPIRAPYLIGENEADFVACHQFSFLEKFDMLKYAKRGATFLLNSIYPAEEVWDHLPREVQRQIVDKELKFYVIDAYRVAKDTGLGVRINTIMQTCFFAIADIIPVDEAIERIKQGIKKSYAKAGEAVLKRNFSAVDQALSHLREVKVPGEVTSKISMRKPVSDQAPAFVREVLSPMFVFEGDRLPVSAMPVDGTFPTATSQWEKRNIALEIPVWDPETCVQCGRCSMFCPHATIRMKVYDPKYLENAPRTFKSAEAKLKQFAGMRFTIQVAPEDCTGCGLCVENCPAKNKANPSRRAINMEMQPPIREQEAENWAYFLSIPDVDRSSLNVSVVRESQLLRPLFEFSGACAGCGETPYVKLLTQLFGDRLYIANATGCSSIYGGNLPTTPYAVDEHGRGPTWSNSLFEDNAEFGLGMRLTIDKQRAFAEELLRSLSSQVGERLVEEILFADQRSEKGIAEQRERVRTLKEKLSSMDDPRAKLLMGVADFLVRKTVWIVGGDGWAYDIGYGGLDHVLASGRDVNVLVLDTEVYSNTGGQSSKSTPVGAIAKFAAGGKDLPKKDLRLMAITYGYVYVASVAMGANETQTLKAFLEADSYEGPSLIVAYSHCIAHGIDMKKGMEQQKLAVSSGIWPLLRYDPRLKEEGKNPLILDSKDPSTPVEDYMKREARFAALFASNPDRARMLAERAQRVVNERWAFYKHLASMQP